MVDDFKQILELWKQDNQGLSLSEFRKKHVESQPQEVEALPNEQTPQITNSANTITQLPERKKEIVRFRMTLSVYRKLEDFSITHKLTLSESVYEILKTYFEGLRQ